MFYCLNKFNLFKFGRLKAVAVFNILSVGGAICCAIISGVIGAHIVNDKDKVCNPVQVYPPIFSDSVKVDCKFELFNIKNDFIIFISIMLIHNTLRHHLGDVGICFDGCEHSGQYNKFSFLHTSRFCSTWNEELGSTICKTI